MSVWMSLIYCGGVAGGQQESENLHMEILTSLSPHLMPDTPAGSYYGTKLAEERRIKYFKSPPATRHNYIKLGVQFPFYPPWRKLIQEWEEEQRDIFVLRNFDQLDKLAGMIEEKSYKQRAQKRRIDDSSTGDLSKRQRLSASSECPEDSPENILNTPELISKSHCLQMFEAANKGCLVMVKLILQHKGTLEPCAIICLPQEEDLEAMDMVKPRGNKEGPVEFAHEDTQHDYRQKLRDEHSKIRVKL